MPNVCGVKTLIRICLPIQVIFIDVRGNAIPITVDMFEVDLFIGYFVCNRIDGDVCVPFNCDLGPLCSPHNFTGEVWRALRVNVGLSIAFSKGNVDQLVGIQGRKLELC